jgi:hypothetical protein
VATASRSIAASAGHPAAANSCAADSRSARADSTGRATRAQAPVDAVRDRGGSRAGERVRVADSGQATGVAEREREFLHREREAVCAAGHDLGQRRLWRRAKQAGEHPGHLVVAEGAKLDLGKLTTPAQPGPDGAQAMAPGKLVAAVTPDDDPRKAACRIRDRGEKAQCRLIGPLKVVKEQCERPTVSHSGQQRAERCGECCGSFLGRPRTELRQDLGQQAGRGSVRVADARADRSGDRVISGVRPLSRAATQRRYPAAIQDVLDEGCLPGAGLAGHEDDCRRPGSGCLQTRAERGALGVAPHELAGHHHGLRSSTTWQLLTVRDAPHTPG